MKKTPVDVPYIVKRRMASKFAQRYGAKAWYEYPQLVGVRRARIEKLAAEAFAIVKYIGDPVPTPSVKGTICRACYRVVEACDEDRIVGFGIRANCIGRKARMLTHRIENGEEAGSS